MLKYLRYFTDIQSAENIKGFSETIRQLFHIISFKNKQIKNKLESLVRWLMNKSLFGQLKKQQALYNPNINNRKRNSKSTFYFNDKSINTINWEIKKYYSQKSIISTCKSTIDNDILFWTWFAGVLDGDGYFQSRPIKKGGLSVLKTIEVKLHNKDIRILNRILDKLHIGRIYRYENNPYSKYIVSTKVDMLHIVQNVNGLIRLKVDLFKLACKNLNVEFKEADYNLKPYDPYFAGLIDTDGSIVFNYASNRIECNLEFKHNEYSTKLNLKDVVPGYEPSILLRKKTINKIEDKKYNSIAFKYQTAGGMIHLYNFFMKVRLYNDMKFYRVSKILKFMEIRKYNKSPYDSEEFLIYSEFLIDWIKHDNPKWVTTPFVKKLRIKR